MYLIISISKQIIEALHLNLTKKREMPAKKLEKPLHKNDYKSNHLEIKSYVIKC